MIELIGAKLKPNCSMSFKINDITEEIIKMKNFPEHTLFMMHTNNGTYIIPKHLKLQLSKGKSYVIKSRYDHKVHLNTTCSYCNGKGCKECDQTGYEPIIIYEASENLK